MNAKPLRPATRDEVSQALGYMLQFNRSGKSHRLATEMTARIATDVLAKHLELAGFVVMKKPPAPLHSAMSHPATGGKKKNNFLLPFRVAIVPETNTRTMFFEHFN